MIKIKNTVCLMVWIVVIAINASMSKSMPLNENEIICREAQSRLVKHETTCMKTSAPIISGGKINMTGYCNSTQCYIQDKCICENLASNLRMESNQHTCTKKLAKTEQELQNKYLNGSSINHQNDIIMGSTTSQPTTESAINDLKVTEDVVETTTSEGMTTSKSNIQHPINLTDASQHPGFRAKVLQFNLIPIAILLHLIAFIIAIRCKCIKQKYKKTFDCILHQLQSAEQTDNRPTG